ncbi:MAG: hypothetical protein ABJG14_18535 [Sulfitobacter sp.]|uniref:hypothetical protein n=1 Tax=Alphaproteobacteria TaxID=28211 RepID=UPI003265B0C5
MTPEQRTAIIEDMVLFITASMKGYGPRKIDLSRMTYFTDDNPALARAILLRSGYLPQPKGEEWASGPFAKPLEDCFDLDDLTDILDGWMPIEEGQYA